MSFGRQKRLLLGWLALLAPLPLPFNDVVGWPVVALYMLGVAVFLRRAAADPPRWLPLWGMNALGLAYLPLFFFDLTVFHRGHLTQPVLHLCLFTLLVKLFAVVRERDKWQATIGVFFLFLAAMGTSVHPAVMLYLVAFLVLVLLLLTRFAFLHVLAGFGHEDPALARLPLRGLLLLATLFTVTLSVPLFALLPRVRSPFIVGRGAATGAAIEAAGFSDSVTLDSIGAIRASRAVVMRVQSETLEQGEEMRFKAATFDLYDKGGWRRSPGAIELKRSPGARFRLSPARAERWLRIWLQPLHSRSLPLPVEATVVEPGAASLDMDQGGAVSFGLAPQLEVREYRVGLASGPVLLGLRPLPEVDPSLDQSGVTPAVARLARQVMGAGNPLLRVRRLEQHLFRNYEYTLNFTGRSSDNPIEDFLFRYHSGHCEYFASAMVLLLRSQGIPARLVTGFLGGEYNPFEGYFIVRDSNAHAWVEAYLPDEGWRIFDPTPAAGRPIASQEGMALLAQQAWDFMLFRWDRYVLTYGVYDQLQVFAKLSGAWQSLLHLFDHKPPAASPAPAATVAAAPAAAPPPAAAAGRFPWTLAGAGLVLAAAAAFLWRWLNRPLDATGAYRRIRRHLGRAGLPVPASTAPLALRRAAGARFPTAAPATARVIDFYLWESFGGRQLGHRDRQALQQALDEAERELRRAG
jgi:transglutaminase-like putative cysteine protease